MKLSELISRAGIFYRATGSEDPEIKAIHTDSRRVSADSLFVCIRGLKQDAHRFIADAVSRGAVAVIAEDERYCAPDGILTIYTHDTRAAAARLWNAWYFDPARDLKLIAVTGTNGKTTVTYMLHAIFTGAMRRCGIIGTVRCLTPERELDLHNADENANMTTPDPEQLYYALDQMRQDGAEYVFIEATSHALALRKLDPLIFDTAIFTNLTPEHLDFHGDMENYFLAKASLLRKCRRAIINTDDEWAERYRSYVRAFGCNCRILTASAMDRRADYFAEKDPGSSMREAEKGISYTLRSSSLIRRIRCPVPGDFTVMNSLEAVACACECGIPGRNIAEALATFVGTPGRLQQVRMGMGFPGRLFIDYAHTPDALENLLTAARGFTSREGKIWLVIGCGGERDRKKRPEMGRIAAKLADFVVLTSDNSRSERAQDIISEMIAGFDRRTPHAVIVDRRRAIEYTVDHAERGDVILLAGKGHEQYEIDAAGRHPFDEKAVAQLAAERRIRRMMSRSNDNKTRSSDNMDRSRDIMTRSDDILSQSNDPISRSSEEIRKDPENES